MSNWELFKTILNYVQRKDFSSEEYKSLVHIAMNRDPEILEIIMILSTP